MTLLFLFAFFSLFMSAAPLTAAADEKKPNPHETKGPAKITLGDKLATIDLPKGYAFFDADTAKAFMKEQGNSPEGVLGIVIPDVPDDVKEGPDYFVVCRFEDIGYVRDDDADKLNADEILNSYKEGTKQQNEELKKRNLPPIYVAGWAQPPHYEKAKNEVIWAISAKDKEDENAPVTVINYNTRILGRRGVLSMNLITDPDHLNDNKKDVHSVLQKTAFTSGNRYQDFKKGDKESGFGLAGLILGGGALAVAAKTGLLGALMKGVIGIVLVLKKFIIVAVLGAIAAVKSFFGGKKKDDV